MRKKDRSCRFLSVVCRPDEMESVQFLRSRNCQGVCRRQTPPLLLHCFGRGIDKTGSLHHIPIKDTSLLTEVFRRRVLKLFVDKGLLDPHFARKILSWKHSGFSVDNSVSILASSRKARVNLSQYIIRHPGNPSDCLQKILYARSNGTIIYMTKYNEYWKENIKLFKAGNFIAELTQHIPPKHKHLIRYYGLYSSRTKGKAHKDGSLAKYGYRARPKKTPDTLPDSEMESVSHKVSRRSWARLIQKVSYVVSQVLLFKNQSISL
jgi:hypothetical protein